MPQRPARAYPRGPPAPLARSRHAVGTVPVQRRNARVNALCSAKPTSQLTSAIETSCARRKASARSRRTASATAAKVVPPAPSRRWSVRGEVPSRRATRASDGSFPGSSAAIAARTVAARSSGGAARPEELARVLLERREQARVRGARGGVPGRSRDDERRGGGAEDGLESQDARVLANVRGAREGEADTERGVRRGRVANPRDQDRERVLLRGPRRRPLRCAERERHGVALRLDRERAARVHEREVGRHARQPLAHGRAGRAEEVEHPERAERRLLGGAQRERGSPRRERRLAPDRVGRLRGQAGVGRVEPATLEARAREERAGVEAEPRARVDEGSRRDGEDGRGHGAGERTTGLARGAERLARTVEPGRAPRR